MIDAIPPEFLSQMADLTSHRIEGITILGDARFDCPIVTQVDGNLWQGGCPEWGLPAYFRYVLNLYPWVKYGVDAGTTVLKVEMFDSNDPDRIDRPRLESLADWVNEKRLLGPTLVHCQAGLNRSALVTGLALIRSGMAADDAIQMLRAKRSPAVLVNATFEAWLRAYDRAA